MVEESPQTPAPHRRSLLAGLLSFIPALALYASSLREHGSPLGTDEVERLLATDLQARRPFGDWTAYARVQSWQVLQDDASRIEAP